MIRSSLEALCDGVVSDPAEVKEYRRSMLSETLHLQRMIGDLLELSRLQNHALICGDYGRIRQMMLILLDNAIKFSPQGERVDVALRCSADTCTFTVSDQGPGISEEALPYIFDRFYTSADPANPQGTGLGLFIAKQVAARHGAELCAENLPDSGSRFIFTCRRYDPEKLCQPGVEGSIGDPAQCPSKAP